MMRLARLYHRLGGVISLILSFGIFSGFVAKGQSVEENSYLVFKADFQNTPSWGIELNHCGDGVQSVLLSTLVTGETRTGNITSAPFKAPKNLSFWMAGYSNQKRNLVRLRHARTGQILRETPVTRVNQAIKQEWDLSDLEGQDVIFEGVDGDTATAWAWISFGRFDPPILPQPSAGNTSIPEGWTETLYSSCNISHVNGIPFQPSILWAASEEGQTATVSLPPINASRLYILGGLNSVDQANPAWGGGDSFHNFFIGDQAGELILTYQSGVTDRIPLIFGYSIWWKTPYQNSPAPFNHEGAHRQLLDRVLHVANGLDGYRTNYPCFVCCQLRDEPLVSLGLNDSKDKVGYPLLESLTFAGIKSAPVAGDPRFVEVSGEPSDPTMTLWLNQHRIDSANPLPESVRSGLEEIRKLLYTLDEDVTHELVSSVSHEVDLKNFQAPKITFQGPPEATILSNIYLDAVTEMLSRISPDGLVHESNPQADNFGGFGGWREKLGPFYNSAYTRNRSPLLLSRMSFQDLSQRVIDFFDRWMMYFPKSFPDVQMAGKPVPGHTTVIANKPHVYFDELRQAGWPTRYKTRDFGNPENDGHGFQMLAHWRAWIKSGRSSEWVNTYWEPIHEAAEYILWCLENPDLSFSEHGLLYSESEGGMMAVTLYCNVPCYLGLLAYADMAEAAGKLDFAKRWQETALKMKDSITTYFGQQAGEWGDIWDPKKAGGEWGHPQGMISPIYFGLDYWGMDAFNQLPEEWKQRSLNGYRKILGELKPAWCAPNGLGYGQGYLSQTALALDQMNDARMFLHWLARFCFAPRLSHPYRVPEGITIATDYSVWRRWGDLGNLYQLNEAIYTILMVTGLDDIDPEKVMVMPRIPSDWTGLSVKGFPVWAKTPTGSRLVLVDLDLSQNAEEAFQTIHVETDHPVISWDIRMGPFPINSQPSVVDQDNQPVKTTLIQSGDSAWARFTVNHSAPPKKQSYKAVWK